MSTTYVCLVHCHQPVNIWSVLADCVLDLSSVLKDMLWGFYLTYACSLISDCTCHGIPTNIWATQSRRFFCGIWLKFGLGNSWKRQNRQGMGLKYSWNQEKRECCQLCYVYISVSDAVHWKWLDVSVHSAGTVITSRRQTIVAFMSTRSPTKLSKCAFKRLNTCWQKQFSQQWQCFHLVIKIMKSPTCFYRITVAFWHFSWTLPAVLNNV